MKVELNLIHHHIFVLFYHLEKENYLLWNSNILYVRAEEILALVLAEQ